MTQAIIAAGGVKPTGSLRSIFLKRKGRVVAQLDMYKLLLEGDSSKDVRLQKGDTLFIPTKQSNITISGEVTRPAHYEIVGETALKDVVSYAGGTVNTAYLAAVTIRKQTQKGIVVETIDYTTPAGRQYKVSDGDEIFFHKASLNLVDAVAVRGQVTKQGIHSFRSGMKVSDILSSFEEDLLPSADLEYALVVREKGYRKGIEVLQFELGKAMANPGSTDDLTLSNRDQIFVFSTNLDVDFWLGKGAQKRIELERQRANDAQVGSSVSGVSSAAKASDLADNDKLSLRERELMPILERLQEQSSLALPAQIIQITGEVKFPGRYPLTQNMTVSDLVKAAGGLMEAAYVEGIELIRFDARTTDETKLLEKVQLDLSRDDTRNGEFVLQSKDRVTVLKNTAWRSEMTVELTGEVMYPGVYAINRGDTILDVIERAGGLTEFAYPNGAVFARESLKERERKQMEHLKSSLQSEIANLTLRRNSSSASFSSSPSEAMALVENLSSTAPLGRMVIDLPAILAGDQDANILLTNLDRLHIPEFDKSVSIIGEVQLRLLILSITEKV